MTRRFSRYDAETEAFVRRFLLSELAMHGWNRTHTAQSLGLERTYLMKLIRDRRLALPPRQRSTRRSNP